MSKARSVVAASKPSLGIPKLFAVVDKDHHQVVARGLDESSARGFAEGWKWTHGPAELVEEQPTWPSDDQVLERLKAAR